MFASKSTYSFILFYEPPEYYLICHDWLLSYYKQYNILFLLATGNTANEMKRKNNI